jgi:hypothetical protein
MVLACRRNIGFEISIRSVRAYDTSFTLRIAWAAVRQAGLQARNQPRYENAMRGCGRRHRHRKATDQLVMRFGTVVPMEKLLQGHRLPGRLGHNRWHL